MPEELQWSEALEWTELDGRSLYIKCIETDEFKIIAGYDKPINHWHIIRIESKEGNEQERKDRKSVLAYAELLCEYQSLKAMFLRMREECGAEKKRADALLILMKDVSELISWRHRDQNDGAKEALKLIYGWLLENPVNVVNPDESNR